MKTTRAPKKRVRFLIHRVITAPKVGSHLTLVKKSLDLADGTIDRFST